jgi:hypothetical protein
MDLKLADEKEKILHEEYDITLTRDMKKELKKMGGLMEPLLKVAVEKASAETEKKSKLEDIRNAMQSWGLTAQDAMTGLKISPELQKELLPLI